MLAADDVENIDQSGEGASGVLSIARSRANGVDNLRLGVSSSADGFGNFQESLQLERRLRDHQWCMQRRKFFDFAGVAYDEGVIWRITYDSDHFRMRGIARDHNMTALLGRTLGQSLHASYKWAGRVNHPGRALLQFGLNLRRHSVRTDYGNLIRRYFRRILNG